MSNQELNTMYVGVSVVEPPFDVVSILPDKDACISSKDCIFNYGTVKEALVLKNDENEWQTLLTFKVPKLESIVLDNLKYAQLELTLSSSAKRDMTLAFCFHGNTNWSETGVTWVNAPSVYKVYKTIDIKAGDSKIIIDIAELIKENVEYTVYGFTFYEISDTSQDISLNIRTKESAYPPKIVYAYNVFPDNVDVSSLDTSFIVNAIENADLLTKFNIKSGIAYAYINTTMNVIGYDDFIDIDTSFNVYNKFGADIDSSLSVNEYYGSSDLNAEALVYQSGIIETPTQFKINEYYDESDINTSLNINLLRTSDIPISFNISEYSSSSDLDVAAKVYIVVGPNNPGEIDAPNTNKPNELSTVFKVKEYSGDSDFEAVANIHETLTANIDTVFTVHEYCTQADIDTSMMVRSYQYLDTTSNVYQKADICLKTSAKVYPTYYKDLDVIVNVDLNMKKPYAFIM